MSDPVRSMTGIGAHVGESDAGRFEVEARSVNHRFLKTSVRHHGAMPNPEATVEARVRARIKRGHVSLLIRYRPPAQDALALRLDEDAFRAAAKRLSELAANADLEPPTTADVIALASGTGDGRKAWDPAVHGKALAAAVEGALDALVASREAEGARMADELTRVLTEIRQHVAALSTRAPEVPLAIRARVEARITELLEGTGAPVEPQWLAREMVLLADRADVTEELARLDAHTAQFDTLLKAGGVMGRQLDFLTQELHRETSTVGSKANDLALSQIVMALKTEVERLREQVQNLE